MDVPSRCQDHERGVVEQRERQIQPDRTHGAARQLDQGHEAAKTWLAQVHVGRDQAGFSPAMDRDTDVGGSQCGGVVDAITHHDDRNALAAQFAYCRVLALRLDAPASTLEQATEFNLDARDDFWRVT